MQIDKIPVGDNPPESLNVIIEVPTGGEPVKYEFDTHMASLAVILPVVPPEFAERQPADGGDPVIALLSVHGLVDVAELRQRLGRKLVRLALDLLQAEHVDVLLAQHARDLVDAQADRIDVPGGDGNHGSRIGSAPPPYNHNKKPSHRGHWCEGSL